MNRAITNFLTQTYMIIINIFRFYTKSVNETHGELHMTFENKL